MWARGGIKRRRNRLLRRMTWGRRENGEGRKRKRKKGVVKDWVKREGRAKREERNVKEDIASSLFGSTAKWGRKVRQLGEVMWGEEEQKQNKKKRAKKGNNIEQRKRRMKCDIRYFRQGMWEGREECLVLSASLSTPSIHSPSIQLNPDHVPRAPQQHAT